MSRSGPDVSGGGGAQHISVSAKFRDQLNSLMKTLSKTSPTFVRCIKPNPDKVCMRGVSGLPSCLQTPAELARCTMSVPALLPEQRPELTASVGVGAFQLPRTFHAELIEHQLRCSGVLAAVKISQSGYRFPTHLLCAVQYICVIGSYRRAMRCPVLTEATRYPSRVSYWECATRYRPLIGQTAARG